MYLVVAGKANKVIAMDLGIGEKTVEVHRAHAMRKMQVDSLAALVQAVLFLHSESESPFLSGNGRDTPACGGQQASVPRARSGRRPRAGGSRSPVRSGRPRVGSAPGGTLAVKRPVD